jgi:hypothetical protein
VLIFESFEGLAELIEDLFAAEAGLVVSVYEDEAGLEIEGEGAGDLEVFAPGGGWGAGDLVALEEAVEALGGGGQS